MISASHQAKIVTVIFWTEQVGAWHRISLNHGKRLNEKLNKWLYIILIKLLLNFLKDEDSEDDILNKEVSTLCLTKTSEISEKLTLPHLDDIERKSEKPEQTQSTESPLESSPSASTHSSPVHKPNSENITTTTHSTPEEVTPNSPQGYTKNVKQKEVKGKGKEAKGKT